ncbi:MAG: helix-turn-helix domain-containing protein [Chloroflexi bacterium]|nr:helix-turn-helix domain-containing protein [Chloroflexota bacterium]
MMKLKVARVTKALSLKALAQEAGVSISTLHMIEKGKTTPRLDVIRKVSAALGVEPVDIDEFAAAIRKEVA